ncbi:phospholipase D-like domain-containing protein [Patescibacteria group bacterium]
MITYKKNKVISPKVFVIIASGFSLMVSIVVIVFAFNFNSGFAMNTIEIDYDNLKTKQPTDKIQIYFNKGAESYYHKGNSRIAKGNVDFSKIIVERIENSQQTIDLAVMYLEDLEIINALKIADIRGVKIRIVTDQEQFELLKSFFVGTNVQIIDNNAGRLLEGLGDVKSIMHYKFGLIDHGLENQAYLITSSANWTPKGFDVNANNLVIIQDQPLIKAYLDEFEQMWEGKFNRNKDMTKHRGEIFEIDGRIVELWMSPGEDPFSSFLMRYVNLFDQAKESVYFATFNFTLPRLSQELSRKYQEGIALKGISNDGSWDINGSVLFDMRGVEHYRQFSPWQKIAYEDIRHDAIEGESSLHYKYFVIDEKITITGASNPTVSAVYSNDEDVLIIHDPLIANEFKQNIFWHFERYGGLTERSKIRIADFDDENETVTLENLTEESIFLNGWKILSVEGVYVSDEFSPKNEFYLTEEHILKPGQKLNIQLTDNFITNNCPEDDYPNSNSLDDGEIYLFDGNDLLHHMVWY